MTGAEHAVDPAALRFRQRAAGHGVSFDHRMTYGEFTLDLDRYELSRQGVGVEVTPTQVELLAVFFAAPNRIWSRAELNAILGPGYEASRRIDVHITRLRRSVGENLFRAVPGHGWILRSVGEH